MPRTKKKAPIRVLFTFNGKTEDVSVENLLEYFRSIKILPTEVKTPARFEVTYDGKTYGFVLNILKLRRFLVNDLSRKLFARQFGVGLGIPFELFNG